MTQEEFLEKSYNLHMNFYDYSKIIYVNSQTKVEIICKEHGSFWQTPYNHAIKGNGCLKCYHNKRRKPKSSTQDFIEKAHTKHGLRYDYQNAVFTGVHNKIEIICKVHGSFSQTAIEHLNGSGCPKCAIEARRQKMLDTNETFIKKANQVHNRLYNYSKVNYINSTTKIEIICKKHGSFFQAPNKHLNGRGCPKCRMSKGELAIYKFLVRHNIEFQPQYKFAELGCLSYDFYISSRKLLIEFNGEQHYHFMRPYHKTEQDLHYQRHRDWLKRKFARDKGYSLLVIHYSQLNNIENILLGELDG